MFSFGQTTLDYLAVAPCIIQTAKTLSTLEAQSVCFSYSLRDWPVCSSRRTSSVDSVEGRTMMHFRVLYFSVQSLVNKICEVQQQYRYCNIPKKCWRCTSTAPNAPRPSLVRFRLKDSMIACTQRKWAEMNQAWPSNSELVRGFPHAIITCTCLTSVCSCNQAFCVV